MKPFSSGGAGPDAMEKEGDFSVVLGRMATRTDRSARGLAGAPRR
jgi:hypothetical protein